MPAHARRLRSLSPPVSRKLPGAASRGAELARALPLNMSVLTTTSESSISWPSLKTEAKQRVSGHHNKSREIEYKLDATLNAFLEWLPVDGRSSIARDIITADNDDKLYELFLDLVMNLVIPMKIRYKRYIAIPPPDTSNENQEALIDSIVNRPFPVLDFRRQCLERDDFRCLVTGEIDTYYCGKYGLLENMIHAPVACPHIIPSSYGLWDIISLDPPDDLRSQWSILCRYFPTVRKAGMRLENIDAVWNGISLRYNLDKSFRTFRLAFKPTGIVNEYEVKTYRDFPPADKRVFLPEDGRVIFRKAENAQEVELPHPGLLDCHYRIAEILDASGLYENVFDHHIEDNGRPTGACRLGCACNLSR